MQSSASVQFFLQFFSTRAEISKQNIGVSAFKLQTVSIRINKELLWGKHNLLYKAKKQKCQAKECKTSRSSFKEAKLAYVRGCK